MGSQGQRPQKEAPNPEQTLPRPMALFLQLQINKQELKFWCFFPSSLTLVNVYRSFQVTSLRVATDEQGCNIM